MSRELHKIKGKDLYALWSTLTDDYITEWQPKEKIAEYWYAELCEEAKRKVKIYMRSADEELDTIPVESEVEE
jgi:hypothetical protein